MFTTLLTRTLKIASQNGLTEENANKFFKDEMRKTRLELETRVKAKNLIQMKLLFIDCPQLKKMLSDFYAELAQDIEFVNKFNVF